MSKFGFLLGTAVRNIGQGGGKAWNYMKVEMKPPTLADGPVIQKGFNDLVQGFKTKKWKQLTVKEAWLNTLISVEIAMWFFAGEVIGRGHLFGYYVPPKVYATP
jgi:F-type H+-transporting ATPase subunit g